MEKIYTAKTFEKAKELAIADFIKDGISEYDINFEIIEQPVKKLFGMKGEYKIKAVVSSSDITSLDDIVAGTGVILRERTEVVPAQDFSDFEYVEKEEPVKPAFVKANPQKGNRTQKSRDSHREPREEVISGEPLPPFPQDEVLAYLNKILVGIGSSDYNVKISINGVYADLDINGSKVGMVIGRRGETLDSIQYLTGLAKNQYGGERYKLSLDCNGYRVKRRSSLEDIAARNAEKVLKYGKNVTLEPMTSYERRVIHNKVSKIAGVTSSSVGSEPYRKVVISSINVKGGSNNRALSRNSNVVYRDKK